MHAARWSIAFVTGWLAAAVPGVAKAQGEQGDGSRDLVTRLGEYVLVGGGMTDFTGDSVGRRFDTGGSWDLRLGIGSRYFVGGEVAYVGSARSGVGSGPDLLMNGAEGVVRVQYPYATGRWLVEPFAFGGIGWSNVSLRDAPPGVKENNNLGLVPFGAGVTLGYGSILVDARFTYRASFSEPSLAVNERATNMDQWGVGASIGYEF